MSQQKKWPTKKILKRHKYSTKYVKYKNAFKTKSFMKKVMKMRKKTNRNLNLRAKKQVIKKETHKWESSPSNRNANQIQAGLLNRYTIHKNLSEKDSNSQSTVFKLSQSQMLIPLSYLVSRRKTRINRVIRIALGQ